MTGRGGLVELAPGARLAVDGVDWTVESIRPQLGQVSLRSPDGDQQQTTIRWLVSHHGCRPVPTAGAGPPSAERHAQQPATLEDLTARQQDLVRLRVAHLLEVETGFRSGDPRQALPGEPRPAYDPATTTLGERRRAKAVELRGLGRDEACLLGVGHVSERTLERFAASYQQAGIIGCVDRRWLRRGGGHPSVSEAVEKAIRAVHAETLRRSKVTMRTRERLIHQYVREKVGPDVQLPTYETLRVVWAQWFGSGRARQRYLRSAAAAAETANEHVVVHRPGQVVALDTTPLPVKVREHVFGDPVSVHLTLALDAYTHSLVAFRLTLVSDTSVDVAMLLRDMTMPLPLRDDWGEDMEWPYPGIPAAVVAEFAGHRVAGLPFFTPETITTDHGAVYKNHHVREVERVLGCNILPARVLRPTDKQCVERAFGAIRSLLLEHLLGYCGIDVADRGVDPEADAVLTADAMERLLATWIVKVWQNRRLGEHAPAWDPGGQHSPNTLFAATMGQGGFALQIPTPELYYQLLPVHRVSIHRRGVSILGLWYAGPALDPYREQRSARGGRHKGKWVIRRDPRDRRCVFFQDPHTHAWHPLRWTGLPADGEVPAFSDARAEELLAEARRRGLKPRSDAELLPVLLELLADHAPVAQWPTQRSRSKQRPTSKRHRTAKAREAAQTAAAARDRPREDEDTPEGPSPTNVVPLGLDQHAGQVQDAIDAERRRRREAAVPRRPDPPPRLGEAFRHRSLFILPDKDPGPGEGDEQDQGGTPEQASTVTAPETAAPAGDASAPFILPGPVVDRESVDGWRRWRLTRHSFVPAPRLALADYRRMSEHDRGLHDLHRAVTNANLPFQETPMSAAVARVMRSRIQNNALKHKPTTRAGLMISGGGYQGKTETACEGAAAFEDQWLGLHRLLNPGAVPGTRDLHAPVAYVQTPVTAKPKSTCAAILDFYGADHHRLNLPQLVRAVRGSLHDHGTRVLLLDDITRLKMHRADDQDALDLIRSLMSMHVTLVLIGVGIPSSGLLREGRHDPRTGQWVFPPATSRATTDSYNDEAATQTERRFDLVNLHPFRYDTPEGIAAWITHLAGIEEHLRLFRAQPGMLTDGAMPEYLFRRTGGIVGLLERLIEDGCMQAIDAGTERLTVEQLDGVAINLGNVPGRDPSAGEIPPIPPQPATAKAKQTSKRTKRPRNTVFDDQGLPAAADT